MRETHRKVARTVSNVLALMDEDPDFTYAMSSAQQYAWLEQEHPDLFARMLQRIKEDDSFPSAECGSNPITCCPQVSR